MADLDGVLFVSRAQAEKADVVVDLANLGEDDGLEAILARLGGCPHFVGD